ncbi:hypothetical protein ABW20_dc0103287 [Dactylellina cionopaga]|nr:hypothetical protein ABW20_dc0103287 [Dactylellina cionopaga]
MATTFKGEAIYTAEMDVHYPMLTVGETLYFAALARAPSCIPGGVDRSVYAEHMRDVIMAMFGISHTIDTPVGDNFIRGVSGGEKKRVTIAEAALSYAPLQCWDNSTRGLDSANAIEFCRTLRTQSDILGATACVAIYQAPQAAYNVFDKVTLLYEGKQIFFGRADEAKAYFERLGFQCPQSQTTPDFLTSLTSPSERIIKTGYEVTAPRTADDFVAAWKQSLEYRELIRRIDEYNTTHPFDGPDFEQFALSRKIEKSKKQRENSPYTLSYWSQIRLCMWRELQKLKRDPSIPIAMLVTNVFEALIVASVFYNLPDSTVSLSPRAAVIFMTILLCAFSSVLEILTLYTKREVVDKHNRYALYHPSAEAISAMILDIPYKFSNCVFTNLVFYFMPGLRPGAGHFFFFLMISFLMILSMSMFFRFFGSITKTVDQAMAPASFILTGLALYTGFTIPIQYMKGWASWIRWINPTSYGFESVMVNEFDGREFPCAVYIPSGPGYDDFPLENKACAAQGSVAGRVMLSLSPWLY